MGDSVNDGYRPSEDLTEKEIQDLIYLNSSIIPGIESVMRMAGLYVNAFTHEKLIDWLVEERYSPDEITNAIKIMAQNGKSSLAYAEGIMRNGKKERGYTDYQPHESREVPRGIQDKSKEDRKRSISKYVC